MSQLTSEDRPKNMHMLIDLRADVLCQFVRLALSCKVEQFACQFERCRWQVAGMCWNAA